LSANSIIMSSRSISILVSSIESRFCKDAMAAFLVGQHALHPAHGGTEEFPHRLRIGCCPFRAKPRSELP